MGFSLKQIKEIIDDSGPVLRFTLIQQKEKLNQEILDDFSEKEVANSLPQNTLFYLNGGTIQ